MQLLKALHQFPAAASDLQSGVHPAGLEPATFGSEDRCSIQLSYGCAAAYACLRSKSQITRTGSRDKTAGQHVAFGYGAVTVMFTGRLA
jgi:hypothetical protein